MNNILVLHKVINLVSNNEYEPNKTFIIKYLDNFLHKFARQNQNNPYHISLTYNNTHLEYFIMYDNETLKTKIYKLDSYDGILFQTLIRPKNTEQRINDIVISAQKILGDNALNSEQIETFKQNLKVINNDKLFNDVFFKETNKCIIKNIKQNEQHGGVLIKMLEDYTEKLESPWPNIGLTVFLEIIDLILLVGSAVPLLGTPFDVASIIYYILRGDFWSIIPGVIDFIPVVGDVVGTVMKVFGKVGRMGSKIAKWSSKFNKVSKVGKFVKKIV